MLIKWFSRIFIAAIVYSAWNVGNAASLAMDKEINDCSDDIVANIGFSTESAGKFAMLKWVRPGGRTQEAFSFVVEKSGNSVKGSRAWLRLSPAKGASIFHAFDSSLGYADFIGYWTALLLIEGKEVAQAKFMVDC